MIITFHNRKITDKASIVDSGKSFRIKRINRHLKINPKCHLYAEPKTGHRRTYLSNTNRLMSKENRLVAARGSGVGEV